ncbi:MAG: cobalamin B12-binding domain-containing protein [Rhizobiaceae bacterium]
MSLKGKRILIAKPGLDGHDIGAKIIAIALRDAGADVIYTGLRKSPEYIARVAVEEDVDALGLSILSGSHNELIAETLACLRRFDAADIKVFIGGTIPPEDHEGLMRAGAAGVFTSDQKLDDVVAAVDRVLAA